MAFRVSRARIRTKQYKLIRFYQFDEWEFYDLNSDPEELHNQYANPKYVAVIARLKDDRDSLRTHYADDTNVSVMPADWQNKFRP